MARLSYAERKRLRNSDFALPKERKYPIQNLSHARNALARSARYATPKERKEIASKVHSKFPSIKCSYCGSHEHMIHPLTTL